MFTVVPALSATHNGLTDSKLTGRLESSRLHGRACGTKLACKMREHQVSSTSALHAHPKILSFPFLSYTLDP